MQNANQHPQYHPDSFSEQFDSSSGQAHWLAWLVILAGACTALVLVAVYLPTKVIEWCLYTVIALPGIGLIIKGFFDVRFLERETRLASSQVRVLEQVDDFESFFQRTTRSVFRAHIENLYTIAQSQPDVDQSNLVEVLHSRLMARNRVVEVFASILITLGLVGTIVGLIFMMNGLSAAIAEQGAGSDLLQRLAKPGGPLNGLGIAFYTTLLGAVLGGVILRVLTSVVDTNIMRYTAHLAELTEVHVLPYMRKQARALHAQSAPAPAPAP